MSTNMILVWGIPDDEPTAAVYSSIVRKGLFPIFLNQRDVLETEVELSVGRKLHGEVRVRSQQIMLDSITSVYLRPQDSRQLLPTTSSDALNHAVNVFDTLVCWAELTSAFVVNRPSAMSSNSSKPYQMSLIRSLGMKTPDTLVTTDVSAAEEFWKTHGSVIYKSVSGVRSIVSRLKEEHRDRLRDVANCPTQFQEYIAGVDYRIHVVGDKTFACELRSGADDYRYAQRSGFQVRIAPCVIPDEISKRCSALAARLGLSVAGIDLRLTPSGEWYCFEVNPSPGFTFYETWTGQRIGDAIAELLVRESIPRTGRHKPRCNWQGQLID